MSKVKRLRYDRDSLEKRRHPSKNATLGVGVYDFDEFDQMDLGEKLLWMENTITRRVNGTNDDLYRCLLSLCKDLASMAYHEPTFWDRLFGRKR